LFTTTQQLFLHQKNAKNSDFAIFQILNCLKLIPKKSQGTYLVRFFLTLLQQHQLKQLKSISYNKKNNNLKIGLFLAVAIAIAK